MAAAHLNCFRRIVIVHKSIVTLPKKPSLFTAKPLPARHPKVT